MKKKILVTATMALMMTQMVPGSAASSTGETTRTAPYDSGCLYIANCVPSAEARNGTLRGGRIPMVTLTYSLVPFPRLTTWEFRSEAGIHVDVAERSSIRFSAPVRRVAPAAPTAVDVKACIAVTPPGFWSYTFRGFGCTSVPADGQATEVTTNFEGSVWGRDGFEPGRWSFWVFLWGDDTFDNFGSFGEVQVDSMSYIIERMDSGGTTPATWR